MRRICLCLIFVSNLLEPQRKCHNHDKRFTLPNTSSNKDIDFGEVFRAIRGMLSFQECESFVLILRKPAINASLFG